MNEPASFAELGTALRHLRERKNLTLNEVAHKARISPSTLSRIEYGSFQPRLGTLAQLLESLEADTLDLGWALREAQGKTCNLQLPEGLSEEERAALALTAFGFEFFVLSLARRAQN